MTPRSSSSLGISEGKEEGGGRKTYTAASKNEQAEGGRTPWGILYATCIRLGPLIKSRNQSNQDKNDFAQSGVSMKLHILVIQRFTHASTICSIAFGFMKS